MEAGRESERRCSRRNGCGWKCPREAREGFKWCERCTEINREYERRRRQMGLRGTPESHRRYTWARRGMDPDQAQKVWERGECEICGSKVNLAVDHCHATGQLRGLLCSNHNRGIGYFADDPRLLQAAIAYLKKHQRRART